MAPFSITTRPARSVPTLGSTMRTRARKIPTHGNEYGAAVGGPVWIPKLYNANKDKTFFFFTYNGFRRMDSASRVLLHSANGTDA